MGVGGVSGAVARASDSRCPPLPLGGTGSGAARDVQLWSGRWRPLSRPPRVSALALLVPGVAAADDHHAAVAADDLAVLADGLDRRVHLHRIASSRCPRTARDGRPLLLSGPVPASSAHL